MWEKERGPKSRWLFMGLCYLQSGRGEAPYESHPRKDVPHYESFDAGVCVTVKPSHFTR